ncbi:hypothetical protein Shyhy02_54100 [Streptomyces hygroscopicus subsp. hygroscopicus]|nr:hypothetical protein Shyhy02_54100 [Streptomyces hygroscopicus subsp. hygroscopicus]
MTLSVQMVERTDLILVHSEARALPRWVRRIGIGEVYGPTAAYGCDGGPYGIGWYPWGVGGSGAACGGMGGAACGGP